MSEYDRLRPLSYPQTDVFLICFSIANRTSFENVLRKWEKEVSSVEPQTPILLVGMQSDLRKEGEKSHVSRKEGERMGSTIGAQSYIECSAKEGVNLEETVREAINISILRSNLNSDQEDDKQCVLF